MLKSLVEKCKESVLYFIVRKLYINKKTNVESFTDFLSPSESYLIIMPRDRTDFDLALEIVNEFALGKKNLTLLVRDDQVSYLKLKCKLNYISVDKESFSKFGLPSEKIKDSLRSKHYNIVIDLNIQEDLFSSSLVSFSQASYRIGFNKSHSENFYNLIIRNNERISEISYRNLLNSLQMF